MTKNARKWALLIFPLITLSMCSCGNGEKWESNAKKISIYASMNALDYYIDAQYKLYYIRYDECCIKVKSNDVERLYSHCSYIIEYKGE